MASKKKLLTSAIALGTAAALTLGGTFAWQSISQKALNEASDIVNPGGRLHDDFDGTNKDVYVENFSDPDNGGQDIFARIRLKEYFEIVMNYGTEAENVETIVGTRWGTTESDGIKTIDYEGEVFKFDDRVNEDGTVNAGVDQDDTAWWTWKTGGQTVFMPTFNLNKDSLTADINGYYKYTNQITSQDIADGQYTEMKTYEVDEEKTAYEIYDGDSNNIDELTSKEVADIIENGEDADSFVNYDDGEGNAITKYIQLVQNTHKAKSTGTTNGLISMAEWLELLGDDDYDADTHGSYWVYDTDGWVYWSSPIKAGDATGLLLNGIALNQVMDDTWYYSIDVEGQFVTANDVGKDEGTGFYHDTDETPTENAEKLLAAIGVDFGEEDNSPVLTLKKDSGETVSYVSASTGDSFRLKTTDGTTPVEVYLGSYGSGPSLEEGTDFTYENGVLTITAKTSDIEGLNDYGSYLYVTGKVDDYNVYYGSILWDDDGKLTLAAFSNDNADDVTAAVVGKGVEILSNDNSSVPDTINLNLNEYGSDYADTSNYTYKNGTLTITNEEWVGRRVKVSYDGGYGYVIVTAADSNSSTGGGQTPDEDEEEETLTLSDYSLTKNGTKLYFTTAITLGDQTITQPSKVSLMIYDPDGDSKGSLVTSDDDDEKISAVDGKVRFDVSEWLETINNKGWDKLGFDVTYKSDDGDKTSEQVQLEIVDVVPAMVAFSYNGTPLADNTTSFKVGVEDTLGLIFKNAAGQTVTDAAANAAFMEGATFELQYSVNNTMMSVYNQITNEKVTPVLDSSNLKMTIDQDYVDDITLTYTINGNSGTITLKPDLTAVYGDATLLRFGHSGSTSADATIATGEIDLNEAGYVYCDDLGYGTHYMTRFDDVLVKAKTATVRYRETDPGTGFSATGYSTVTIDKDGVGTLDDGTEVCKVEYPETRCQKITFKKTGYVRVDLNLNQPTGINERGALFAIVVNVTE